jgi:hypothetical protein
MKALSGIFIGIFIVTVSKAQRIATLTVPVSGPVLQTDIPVNVNLDEITQLPDSVISLVEVQNGKRVPVAFQIESKGRRTLYWMLRQNGSKAVSRTFELVKGAPPKDAEEVEVTNDAGSLVISAHRKHLLQYNYKMHYPPAGADSAFKRSGFIHPLWTPHGQALTRINPPDHYHHYGLWNPWTKVLFEGQTVDFWNLKERQGTVRFADLVSVNQGAVYGDYQTLHQHVAFKKDGSEKVAINELQSVRVYQPSAAGDYYLADITIQLNCASGSPVVLKEYRYGGLGWRATADWTRNNSEMLTSEGKTRKEADGSKARWVIVQGSLGQDYGGAVMMSYPVNYNYPEPLRIWPENIMKDGDVYANFSPTKDKDWHLEPGHDYVLKYRFLVFNGRYDQKKAEAAWQYFAHPPVVVVKR